MDDLWTPDAASIPQRVGLSDSQQDHVRKYLRSIDLTFEPFPKDGRVPKACHDSRLAAAALFSAILEATRETHKITMNFHEWCRKAGLPW